MTAIPALPVLVGATAADQEGILGSNTFLPPLLVRRLRDGDLNLRKDNFSRSFQNAEKQELVAEKQEFFAVVELIQAYKLRMHASRKGEWKKAWKEARRKYERSLVTYKETRLQQGFLEGKKERREWGRYIIEILAPACGVDLGTESPERAADLWDGYLLSRYVKDDPQLLLCQIISKHLCGGAQLVLWCEGGRFQPALYCTSKRAAFYVKALLALDERKGWAVCQYSRCGEIFFQSRPDKECCSPKHANAHRMEEYRKTPKGRRAMRRDEMRRRKR